MGVSVWQTDWYIWSVRIKIHSTCEPCVQTCLSCHVSTFCSIWHIFVFLNIFQELLRSNQVTSTQLNDCCCICTLLFCYSFCSICHAYCLVLKDKLLFVKDKVQAQQQVLLPEHACQASHTPPSLISSCSSSSSCASYGPSLFILSIHLNCALGLKNINDKKCSC